jgi:hypothetical protein
MKKKRARTAITRKRAQWFLPSCIALVLASVLFPSSLSHSQHTHNPRHAIIFGTVWGPDDRPLPGIEVKIRRASEQKARWDLISNRRGEFELAVPAGPGDYVIWAVTKHYKLPNGKHLQPSPEVTVHIDAEERADTGLHLK